MTGAVIPVDEGRPSMYPCIHPNLEATTSNAEGSTITANKYEVVSGRHCTLVVRERNGLLSRHLAWPTSGTLR